MGAILPVLDGHDWGGHVDKAYCVLFSGRLFRVVWGAGGTRDGSTIVVEVGDGGKPISGEGVGVVIRWE